MGLLDKGSKEAEGTWETRQKVEIVFQALCTKPFFDFDFLFFAAKLPKSGTVSDPFEGSSAEARKCGPALNGCKFCPPPNIVQKSANDAMS